jgi:hypothetical protein
MKNYKNYLIALLTGLLVLTLTTQPSIGAGKSKEAKTVEYQECLKRWQAYTGNDPVLLDAHITLCSKYRP